MKYLLFALLAVAPAAFAETAAFEIKGGCAYSSSKAVCAVENKTGRVVTCEVETLGRTARGMRIGSTKTVVIYPDKAHFSNVFATDTDKFEDVKAQAFCK